MDLEELRDQHLTLVRRMLTRDGFNDGSYKPTFDGPPILRETYDPYKRERGRDWPQHAETMIGTRRLRLVHQLLDQCEAEGIPGDFVECGIWRGGVCILAALWNQLYQDGMFVWGLDSFQGLPAPGHYVQDDPDDPHHKVDLFAVSMDEVVANFEKYDVNPTMYDLIPGWFKDTCRSLAQDLTVDMQEGQGHGIRILRIDGDMYEGTMDPLKHLEPLVVPGGFIIVDDYGDVRECREAVHDYFKNKEWSQDFHEFDHTCVYWRKP